PASSRPEDVKVAREWDEFVNHTLMECYVNGAYSVHQMTYAKNHGIDMKIVEGEMEAIARMKSNFISFSYYASTTLSAKNIPEG
ncbi:family 1 glycosylhydrolase, partial [Streptococcus pyogenes]